VPVRAGLVDLGEHLLQPRLDGTGLGVLAVEQAEELLGLGPDVTRCMGDGACSGGGHGE
jgi:hypothetical protein